MWLLTILHLPVVCSCSPPRRNLRCPRSRWPVTEVTRLNWMCLMEKHFVENDSAEIFLKWLFNIFLTRVWPLGPPSLLRSTNIVSISLPSQATNLFLWPSNCKSTEICYFPSSRVVSPKECVLACVPPLLTWPGLAAAPPSWPSAVNPLNQGTASSFQTSGRWGNWELKRKYQNLKKDKLTKKCQDSKCSFALRSGGETLYLEGAAQTAGTSECGTAECAQSEGHCLPLLLIWAPALGEKRQPWTASC